MIVLYSRNVQGDKHKRITQLNPKLTSQNKIHSGTLL